MNVRSMIPNLSPRDPEDKLWLLNEILNRKPGPGPGPGITKWIKTPTPVESPTEDAISRSKLVFLEAKYNVHYLNFMIVDPRTNKCVGTIEVEDRDLKKPKMFYSFLEPKYGGKGIGVAAYERVVHRLQILYSDANLSPGSSKVWKFLVETYSGSLLTRGPDRQQVEVPVHDFKLQTETKFWSPVVKTKSGPLVLSERLDWIENQPGYLRNKELRAERLAIRGARYVVRS